MGIVFDLTKEIDSDVDVDYVDIEPEVGMQTVVIKSVIGQVDSEGRKRITLRCECENGAIIFDSHFLKRERDGEDDEGTVTFLRRIRKACELKDINDVFGLKNVAIRATVKKQTDENGLVKTDNNDKPFYALYGVEALPAGIGGGAGGAGGKAGKGGKKPSMFGNDEA